jgi:zinc protease
LFSLILALTASVGLAQDPADPEAAESAEDVVAAPEVVTVEHGFISNTLDNGLHVSILSDPSMPIVATQIWVQVGSAHEADNEKGFAHLFEHLMFGETSRHDKEDYARLHTANGGSENAYTAFDNTVYISEIAPAVHDTVLELEADRLVNLILSAENLANEQKIVTEELRMRTENNPAARLLGPALAGIFGEHPYSHSPAGTKEDIAAADLELVKKFYEGYYHPANLHLVIVGPVPGEQTMARVEELFGVIDKERLVPPEVPSLSSWTFPARMTLKEDLPPIKIAGLVYFGPDIQSEDYWPYRVMTEMLAGGELDRLREELVSSQGKAVEAFTIAQEFQTGSFLAFASLSLPLRCKRKAFRLLDGAIGSVGQGDWMSEASLETVRRRMLRQELSSRYYAASMAEALGTAYAWQGDDRLALGGNSEAIEAVTLEQVQAVWASYVVDATPMALFIKKGKPTAEVGGSQ